MFSFASKKPNPPPKSKSTGQAAGSKPRSLAQFGLLDLGIGNDSGDEDDGDLEAELAALTRGAQSSHDRKARKPVVSEKELAAMVNSSLADIPSDAEISDIDDAEVEDELGELFSTIDEDGPDPGPNETQEAKAPTLDAKEMTKLLEDRLLMYQTAEKNANQSNDSTKARRFNRGVKSLNDMLKQVKAGKPIVMEDVPPPLAESNKTIQPKPVPKDIIVPQQVMDDPIPSLETNNPAPILPQKPLLPVRVAPPPPPQKTLPPIPPRAIVPKPMEDIDDQGIKNDGNLLPSSTVPSNLDIALARRQELKSAALQAKRAGDQASALQFVRLVKACEQMIEVAKQGSDVDWSQLPSVDLVAGKNVATVTPVEIVEKEKPETSVIPNDTQPMIVDVPKEPVEAVQVPAIPIPSSTLEALEQRLAKYQSIMQQAQEEGNSSKVRRFGRIVKQYQDAIKLNKLGKPVPFDELPDPPGFPPIPGAPTKVEMMDQAAPLAPDETSGSGGEPAVVSPQKLTAPATGQVAKISPKISPKKTALATRQDKQLALLLERQNMFRQAALEAKKSGDLLLAKEYLRMAKGIDPLISANKCGIPVDMDTLPIPPQMKLRQSLKKGDSSVKEGAPIDDFVVLSSEECGLVPSLQDKGSSEMFTQLEADLLAQIKMCSDNRDHYKLMGDIANANRFDQLALHTRKDLDVVRSAAMRGDVVPRWKNEMRTFSIVKCCTDLKDDDMEVTVLRGLSYNVANPKTIDTYVRFEVPLPNTENPTKEKTNLVRDTNSPEYNESFHVNINRHSRTLLRIFKAKQIKFEVWAKGGFLRSDVLVGTATVKLADLLNHCQVHEAADLLDGRKPVGGKLEVKIRLRDPIVGKETEKVQEKWTVLC